ncbi:MAG: DNA-binding domain-containing protein [Parvibaculum sp.]
MNSRADNSLSDFQVRFAAAVNGAPADGLNTGDDRGIPLERRMDVYRNNVHASLIDALASAFSVVQKLVGEEFFRAMAREFLRMHMPRSRTLIGFGEEFPAFLDDFPPVATLAYLGDVARLECAWLRSYHAGNEGALGPQDFADVPEREMDGLVLTLHPGVQLFSSDFPVWSIWQSNQNGYDGPKVAQKPESVLMMRPKFAVELHLVDVATIVFVEALADGRMLGDAVEAGMKVGASFDPSRILGLFLSGGGFSRFHPTGMRGV